MRKRWLDVLHKVAQRNKQVIFIGSDLTADEGMRKFSHEMPAQFFMEGISEAHLVGMASGMATSGKIVYFNTIATFISRRCYEQNVIDLGLTNANVRLIGNGGGLVYTPLGPTHLALEDLAIMRVIPHMTVIAPCDADEMERAILASVDHKGPIYFRCGKGGEPIVSKAEHGFSIGKAIVHVQPEPADALIITTGILLPTALQAADLLAKHGIATGVIHVPTVKPLDEPCLVNAMRKSQVVVTLEEHFIAGGLGSAVCELIAENAVLKPRAFKRLGVPDLFPDEYGSQASLLAKYGLSVPAVVETIRGLHKA